MYRLPTTLAVRGAGDAFDQTKRKLIVGMTPLLPWFYARTIAQPWPGLNDTLRDMPTDR